MRTGTTRAHAPATEGATPRHHRREHPSTLSVKLTTRALAMACRRAEIEGQTSGRVRRRESTAGGWGSPQGGLGASGLLTDADVAAIISKRLERLAVLQVSRPLRPGLLLDADPPLACSISHPLRRPTCPRELGAAGKDLCADSLRPVSTDRPRGAAPRHAANRSGNAREGETTLAVPWVRVGACPRFSLTLPMGVLCRVSAPSRSSRWTLRRATCLSCYGGVSSPSPRSTRGSRPSLMRCRSCSAGSRPSSSARSPSRRERSATIRGFAQGKTTKGEG